MLIRPTPEQYGVEAANVARTGRLLFWLAFLPPAFGGLVGVGMAVTSGEPLLVMIIGSVIFGLEGFSVGAFVLMIGFVIWDRFGFPLSATLHGYWRYQRDLTRFEAVELRQREEFWLRLSGRGFELELAKLFAQSGWAVEVTPASGDQGIDLLLKRGSETVVVQCKATEKPAGPAVVRDLYGAMTATHADSAIIASLAGVTTGAKSFMAGKPITVLALREIMYMHEHVTGA